MSRQPTSYELVDHTADLGFVVEAADLETLFERAALALHDIVADTSAVVLEREVAMRVAAPDLEDLLIRFLEEALYVLEAENVIFGEVEVLELCRPDGARPGHVLATGRGEALDPDRHETRRPVKAVTYHDLEVVDVPGGSRARVILDL